MPGVAIRHKNLLPFHKGCDLLICALKFTALCGFKLRNHL